MAWREMREADLLECLAIGPCNQGDEIVGRDTALAVWRGLIRSRCFNSCVIESASRPGRILGFGASVFVTPEFATREIEHPKPHLNSRIVASIANRESAVRAEADLYNTPVNEPLDVLVLGGAWMQSLLGPEEVREIQMLLAFSFVALHTGYRLNRLINECMTPAEIDFIQSSGVWQLRERFANPRSGLFVLTKKDAFAVSGSVAISLFQYQEPILGLRNSEKHFLVGALNLRSDEKLAKGMNLSLATVKKRWQALFERVADAHPSLLPANVDESSKLTRGPQKRHHILAYVCSHPEELRPYRWRTL